MQPKLYDLITANPRWHQQQLEDICRAIPPSAADATLLMWVPRTHMPQALKVIDLWGFTYEDIAFTWLKPDQKAATRQVFNLLDERLWFQGTGKTTRGNEEFCLLATRGKGLARASANVRSTLIAPRGRDSEKPPEFFRRLERLYPQNMYRNRLEMFTRSRRDGWDAYGNVVGSINLQYQKITPYQEYLWRKLLEMNGRGGRAITSINFSAAIGKSERTARFYLRQLLDLGMAEHPRNADGEISIKGGWIAVVNPLIAGPAAGGSGRTLPTTPAPAELTGPRRGAALFQ